MIEKIEKKFTITDERSAKAGWIFVSVLPYIYILAILLRDFRDLEAQLVLNIGVNLMAGTVCAVVYYSCMRDSAGIGKHNRLFLSLLISSGISVFLAGSAWIVNGVPSLIFWNRLLNVLLFIDNY
ncbi:MAG: hypothetical protein IKP86_03365, partial [Anaerolineaceae bacterium]|nr:hypothetical protein [Anaerolineaceae bacterium]